MADNFLYILDHDLCNLCIIGVNDELKKESHIIIPSKILCKGRYYVVTKIGFQAFCQCEKLKDIIIPSSVTFIGTRAFKNCENLERVVIPDSVIHIGIEAFYNCKKLKAITLPPSVKYVGWRAFKGCEKLENIDYFASVETVCSGTFENCFSLRKVVLPQGIIRLDPHAFRGCSNLKSIELPQSTQKIEREVFYDCKSLNKIICNSISPPEFEFVDDNPFGFDVEGTMNWLYSVYYCDPFDGIDKNSCFLYVPGISIEKYKETMVWSGFTINGL